MGRKLINLVFTRCLLFLYIFIFLLDSVKGHAALYEPPNRASIWRFPEFTAYKPVINPDDHQNYCGGFTVQHSQNKGQCGICGDDYATPQPRDNESGGKYDIGLIVRNYTVGQTIPTSTGITSNHLGYFEFSLCPRNSSTEPEVESCFEPYQLPVSDGIGFRYYPVMVGETLGLFNVSVTLPKDVTCSWCVFRWQYITGNTWGYCENGDSGRGCGPQEEYRGCSDIAIF